jgi:uncharacterized protein YjlB
MVVGAYLARRKSMPARTTIPKVALPRKDPVYGRDGSLMSLWRRH